MPEPTSLPDHFNVKLAVVSVAGRALTWLVGGVLSRVLSHVGVLMGALTSKTIVARFCIWVFVGRPCFGFTVKKTLPLPPGGRKPTVGSLGGRPVAGSSDWKFHVSNPFVEFNLELTATRRFVAGRRSTVVEKVVWKGGGVNNWVPKPIGPRLSVPRLSLVLSSWSVIDTCCAGAVAVGSFPK